MKKVRLVIGLVVTLLFESPIGQAYSAVGVSEPGTGWTAWNPDSTINGGIGHAAGIPLANGNGRYDTAIEVHQGGQDGGGALW